MLVRKVRKCLFQQCHTSEILDRSPNPALLPVAHLVGKGKVLQWCYGYLSFSVLTVLDEVYKVAETGEKAVKNVANQATSWGKSFGQWRKRTITENFVNRFLTHVLLNKENTYTPLGLYVFLKNPLATHIKKTFLITDLERLDYHTQQTAKAVLCY